jgi:uncharacterized protein YggE
MNRIVRTIAAAMACALLLPAVARAQQSTLLPTGVTVVGTGVASVKDWVQEVSLRFTPAIPSAPTAYDTCSGAIASLNESLRSMGLQGAMLDSAVVYTSPAGLAGLSAPANATPVAVARVDVPPAAVARFMAAANKSGWKTSTRLVPRDPAAAKDSAYQAAFLDAKNRAETIAAADGKHVGKLLNVTPALGDYFGSMVSSLASFAEMLGKGSGLGGGLPEVSQSATFTFELLP